MYVCMYVCMYVPKYSRFPFYDICRDIAFAQITRLSGNLTQQWREK